MKNLKLLSALIILLYLNASECYSQKSLFPQIDKWKVVQEAQVYDANNLWDLIDGAADLFLEYSFIDLNLARYTNDEGIEVKAEIYKHTDPLSSFGMYSQERDPSNHFLEVGLQGYIDEGILNFADGEYYIKLSTLQKGAKAQDALILVAKQISKSLNKVNKLPGVLDYFPNVSKIQNSEKYIAQNFLGYSFLRLVMTVRYQGAEPFTGFILDAGSAGEAVKVIEELKKLPNNQLNTGANKEMYSVKTADGSPLIFTGDKQFVWGIINCSDNSAAVKFLETITGKIGK